MSGLRADRVAQASTSYDAARILPDGVFWVEGRPDGRDVLVRWTHEQGSQDVTPDGFSVGSYVHEYGGGAWAAADGVAWFCNAEDQRVYRVAGSEVTPVSPAGGCASCLRQDFLAYAIPFCAGQHGFIPSAAGRTFVVEG